MKIIIAYIIISLFVIEVYAGDPPLQFKVDFKELKNSNQFSNSHIGFGVRTDTVIKANTDEWCERLELEIHTISFLYYKYFSFLDYTDDLDCVVGMAPADTKITFTENVSRISSSSTNGYQLISLIPRVFQQRVLVNLDPLPEWSENNVPESWEISVVYAPVVLRANLDLFLLSPKLEVIPIVIHLRKSGNIKPVQTE